MSESPCTVGITGPEGRPWSFLLAQNSSFNSSFKVDRRECASLYLLPTQMRVKADYLGSIRRPSSLPTFMILILSLRASDFVLGVLSLSRHEEILSLICLIF